MIDEILPQTATTHDLEVAIKKDLGELDPNRQLAEMHTIQSDYMFIVKDQPDWTDDECKAHVYRQWLEKNAR